MYKACLKGNKQIEVTKESEALRPINAYQRDAQVERNTVYAIVKTIESRICIKLFDMNAKKTCRIVWLEVDLAKVVDEQSKAEDLLQLTTNIGSFKTLTGIPETNIPAGNRIMSEIWTKSVPQLLTIIQLIDSQYSKEKAFKYESWLGGLSPRLLFDLKVSIAKQLGDKKYLKFVGKL